LAAVLGYGVVIAAWIFTDVEGTNIWTYVMTLFFMTIYLLLLAGRYAWNYPQVRSYMMAGKWRTLFVNRYLGVKALVLVLVVAELACNTYMTSIRTVNRDSYMAHFHNAEGAVSYMKELDDGLYRTEIFSRLTKNDSMMWDVNTATVFSSTANANVVDFYKALGLGTTRVSYWYQGATPLVSALLGVKYMIGKDDSMDNALYSLVYSDEKGALYEADYTLPMGYVVDSELEEAWDLDTYNPVKVQNEFCHLLGVSGDLLVPLERKKVDDSTYTVTVNSDEYVFVYLGNNALSEVKYTAGEKSQTFKQVSFDYLLDLGLLEAGTTAQLETVKEGQTFKTFRAYTLNLRVLQEVIDILSRETLTVTEHADGYLKGHVTLEEVGKLVISIPMEKGWTMWVNGQETDIETFEDTLMAVSLEPGDYDIELKFQTPGAISGFAVTVACIVILVICCRIEYLRFRKCKRK
ncbi:MAG: YfhO family protein, partial [Lachnospiraceae bacterium]|nr:YfhO family protein [Lachnospiraceae bacterium]